MSTINAVNAVSVNNIGTVNSSGAAIGAADTSEALSSSFEETLAGELKSLSVLGGAAETQSADTPSTEELLTKLLSVITDAINDEDKNSAEAILKKLSELLMKWSGEKKTDYNAALSYIADSISAMLESLPTAAADSAQLLTAVTNDGEITDFQFMSENSANLKTGDGQVGGQLLGRGEQEGDSGVAKRQFMSEMSNVQSAGEMPSVTVEKSETTEQPIQSEQTTTAEESQSVNPFAALANNKATDVKAVISSADTSENDVKIYTPSTNTENGTAEITQSNPNVQDNQNSQNLQSVQGTADMRNEQIMENPTVQSAQSTQNSEPIKVEITEKKADSLATDEKAADIFDKLISMVKNELNGKTSAESGNESFSGGQSQAEQLSQGFIRPKVVRNSEFSELTGNASKSDDGEATDTESAISEMTAGMPTEMNIRTEAANGSYQIRQSQPIENLADEIYAHLETLDNGTNEFTLRLSPDDLGEISIKITENNGKVSVEIATANAETHRLLEGRAENLAETLREKGVELERYQAVYEAPADEQANNQNHSNNQSGENRDESGRENQGNSRNDAPDVSFSELLATM